MVILSSPCIIKWDTLVCPDISSNLEMSDRVFFYTQYGDVFSFMMVGKTFTYAIGSDPCSVFFNSKNEDLNAEEVYSKLVTPVFGKGVAYDVPNKVYIYKCCVYR